MLTLATIIDLLRCENLLREVVYHNQWYYEVPDGVNANTSIDNLTYDSRQVKKDSLFICKGLNFKTSYLYDALNAGATMYLAERFYEVDADTIGIVTTDVQKAMAVLARAFYGNPDEQLTMIAYTGTKGKTTSTYIAFNILERMSHYQAGQLTSIDNIVDGHTAVASTLTTPESLDLFRLLREAVDNGLKYIVMEVSSQAYKLHRVHGITFDIGIFLNISPDHISESEHSSFDEYFDCKTQLFKNSKRVILNANSDYAAFIKEKIEVDGVPYITYGDETVEADYTYRTTNHHSFHVTANRSDVPAIDYEFEIQLIGDFNQGNAVSAIIIALLLGANTKDMQEGILATVVPGRMEYFTNGQKFVYVDYAHNYISFKKSLEFLHNRYNGRVIVVTGSTGGKATSRRQDIGRVLGEEADVAFVTSDDNFFERAEDIIQTIADHIQNEEVEVHKVVDRAEAIEQAVAMAGPEDVVFVAGKGRERFFHDKGIDIPYEGDDCIVKRLLNIGEE